MNTKYIPWIIIVILAFILWMKGCEKDEPETITVKVPEISGEFEPQKPVYIKKTDTVFVTKWKKIHIETENPVNDSLAIAYQEVKDSLERYKMFLTAIQIRQFSNEFEDDNIKMTITGEVQGQLNWVKPIYTIKEREIEVEVPETVLRLLAGAEIGNNLMLNDFRYSLKLGLQNGKGNIYRLGYGNENLQHYIYLGMDFSVFQIKK